MLASVRLWGSWGAASCRLICTGLRLLNPFPSLTSIVQRWRSVPAEHLQSLPASCACRNWESNLIDGHSPAVPDWGAAFAGAVNTSMGGGGAPGIGSKQDQSIETLLAEFQAAPSISLGDFPTLDESFLRQTGTPALLMQQHTLFLLLVCGARAWLGRTHATRNDIAGYGCSTCNINEAEDYVGVQTTARSPCRRLPGACSRRTLHTF